MPILPRRFERLRAVLNQRMANLTVLVEHVDKPHNLSAILRSCDAVGVLEAHAVSLSGRSRTYNSTAQGSQRWVPLHGHPNIEAAVKQLKDRGFHLYGTNLSVDAVDYRDCDFTGPSAFVLGAEKWGLSENATKLMETTGWRWPPPPSCLKPCVSGRRLDMPPPMGRESQQRTTTICCSIGPIQTLHSGAAKMNAPIQRSTKRVRFRATYRAPPNCAVERTVMATRSH